VGAESRTAAQNRARGGHRKLIWAPAEKSLTAFDTAQDPLEIKPHRLGASSAAYESETALLARWFESTDGGSGQTAQSKRDIEVLRSLGYLQ
jgi:hypothetical protein